MTTYDVLYGTLNSSKSEEGTRPWARADSYQGIVVALPEGKLSRPAERDQAEAVARELIHEKTGEALEEIKINLMRFPTMH